MIALYALAGVVLKTKIHTRLQKHFGYMCRVFQDAQAQERQES